MHGTLLGHPVYRYGFRSTHTFADKYDSRFRMSYGAENAHICYVYEKNFVNCYSHKASEWHFAVEERMSFYIFWCVLPISVHWYLPNLSRDLRCYMSWCCEIICCKYEITPNVQRAFIRDIFSKWMTIYCFWNIIPYRTGLCCMYRPDIIKKWRSVLRRENKEWKRIEKQSVMDVY